MNKNGTMHELARVGAEVKLRDLRDEIAALEAAFPGLTAAKREDAAEAPRVVRRRRRRVRRATIGLRKPKVGELQAFIMSHADMSRSGDAYAAELLDELRAQGITTSVHSVSQALYRERRRATADAMRA